LDRAEIMKKGIEMRETYAAQNTPDPASVKGLPMELQVDGQTVFCRHYPSRHRKNGPAFIDIHGGGFLWASPEEDDSFCANLSETLDIEVYSPDYLRTPEHMFPEALNLLYATVKHFADHAEAFNFDPAQLSIGGHSAGGNFSAAIALMNRTRKDFALKCQVLDYPGIDLRPGSLTQDMFQEGDILSVELMDFFQEAYVSKEDTSNILCSPVCAKKEDMTGLPPAVVMTCGNDVLRFQGRRYAQMLVEANVPVLQYEYPNVTHAFDVFPGPEEKNGQDFLIGGLKFFLDL
jgi:acetyl esterase